MKTINYEIAQRLKHIGFDLKTQNRFNKNGILNKTGELRYGEPINWNNECFNDGYRNYCSAPTSDEVYDWFFNIFKIFPYIKPTPRGEYVAIINYGNNIWFDKQHKDLDELRNILFLETIKLIEKEFLNECLIINSYQIEEGNILIFNNKHGINMTCFRPGDEKNFVSFHFMKMNEPQPEVYMDIVINQVKNNIRVKDHSVDLGKLLIKYGYNYDKTFHLNHGFKPQDFNIVLKINLNAKFFEYSPYDYEENKDQTDLSNDDALILIDRLQ